MFGSVIKDIYLRAALLASGALYGLVALLMAVKFASRRETIVLHFDVYQGIDFVGGRIDLFGALFAGFFMVILNFLLADFLYSRDRFLSYLLSFASLLLVALLAVAMAVVSSAS